MKALMSRIIRTPMVYLGTLFIFPLLCIILVPLFGSDGITVVMFFAYLSSVSILPNSKGLMFEASMPGKRSKGVVLRYGLTILIIAFYTVLIFLLGLGEVGPDHFGFDLFAVMLVISLEYPAMFLISDDRMKGFFTGFLSAILVIILNTNDRIWPYGEWTDFLRWIVLGLPLIYLSALVTVRVINKRGVTC